MALFVPKPSINSHVDDFGMIQTKIKLKMVEKNQNKAQKEYTHVTKHCAI